MVLQLTPKTTPYTSDESASSSRSSSPFFQPLPESVASFFSSVSLGGFPEEEEKAQPWKSVWKQPQGPDSDGKLLVACPKRCVYGKFAGPFL
jgi:hypothetical protein